jgi:hypothetical protein
MLDSGKAYGFAQDQTSYAGLDLASFQKQASLLLRRIQLCWILAP